MRDNAVILMRNQAMMAKSPLGIDVRNMLQASGIAQSMLAGV